MDGLSHKRRRLYLIALAVVFVTVGPVLALYASGYRFSTELSLVRTGGINVNVPESGATFFLDAEYVGESSLFRRSFFVQDLRPDTYRVSVHKPEHYSWEKQLMVLPQRVARADAFLVRTEPDRIPIATTSQPLSVYAENGRRELPEAAIATTGPDVSEANAYELVNAFFTRSAGVRGVAAAPAGATTTFALGTTTDARSATVRVGDGIGLWQDARGQVRVRWLRDVAEMPYVFCTGGACRRELVVTDGADDVTHVTFAPTSNLQLLLERPDGIYLTELDPREPRNTVALSETPGVQMRVINGRILVRDGLGVYALEL